MFELAFQLEEYSVKSAKAEILSSLYKRSQASADLQQ